MHPKLVTSCKIAFEIQCNCLFQCHTHSYTLLCTTTCHFYCFLSFTQTSRTLRWITSKSALSYLAEDMSIMESFKADILKPFMVKRVSGTKGNLQVQNVRKKLKIFFYQNQLPFLLHYVTLLQYFLVYFIVCLRFLFFLLKKENGSTKSVIEFNIIFLYV